MVQAQPSEDFIGVAAARARRKRLVWMPSAALGFVAYVFLVLLPAAVLARVSDASERWIVWTAALAGLAIAPPLEVALWRLRTGGVLGRKPIGALAARAAEWRLAGRAGCVSGFAFMYAGVILVSMVGSIVHGSDRPIGWAALPGLAVMAFAPLLSRLAALGDIARCSLAAPRRFEATLLSRDDASLLARAEEVVGIETNIQTGAPFGLRAGDTIEIDAASATGLAALGDLPEAVRISGGELGAPQSAGAVYRQAPVRVFGVSIESLRERRASRIEVWALAIEVATYWVVPAIWLKVIVKVT